MFQRCVDDGVGAVCFDVEDLFGKYIAVFALAAAESDFVRIGRQSIETLHMIGIIGSRREDICMQQLLIERDILSMRAMDVSQFHFTIDAAPDVSAADMSMDNGAIFQSGRDLVAAIDHPDIVVMEKKMEFFIRKQDGRFIRIWFGNMSEFC